MTPRQTRMVFVGIVLAGVAIATTLVISAIGENMLYFFSPTQIKAGEAPSGRTLRVGGLVVPGSIQREEGSLVDPLRSHRSVRDHDRALLRDPAGPVP